MAIPKKENQEKDSPEKDKSKGTTLNRKYQKNDNSEKEHLKKDKVRK